MNRILLAVVVAAGSVVGAGLGGCGNDDGSKGRGVDLKDPASVGLTKVTSPTQGASAAIGSRDGANQGGSEGEAGLMKGLGSMSGGLLKRVFKVKPATSLDHQAADALRLASKGVASADKAAQKQRIAARLRDSSALAEQAMTNACDLGGTMTEDVSETTDSITWTTTYSNCDMGFATGYHDVTNGTLKGSFTQTTAGGSGTMSFGDGDGELENSDFTVTTYDGTVKTGTEISSFSLTFSWAGDIDATAEIPFELTMDGRASSDTPDATETVAFDNFGVKFSVNMTTMDSIQSSVTLSGAIEEVSDKKSTAASPDETAYFGFVDFTYTDQMNSAGQTMTIDGKTVVEHTPADCKDGAYTFDTTTPFQWNSAGVLTAGDMTINDNVTIHANGDGTITVTVNGVPQTFTSFKEIEGSVCMLM